MFFCWLFQFSIVCFCFFGMFRVLFWVFTNLVCWLFLQTIVFVSVLFCLVLCMFYLFCCLLFALLVGRLLACLLLRVFLASIHFDCSYDLAVFLSVLWDSTEAPGRPRPSCGARRSQAKSAPPRWEPGGDPKKRFHGGRFRYLLGAPKTMKNKGFHLKTWFLGSW